MTIKTHLERDSYFLTQEKNSKSFQHHSEIKFTGSNPYFIPIWLFETWSAVEFIDDRSVEVVPAYWLNKNKRAWPKKIQKRVKPNEIEFDFLKAHKLGKDKDNYTLAREKAKKAGYMSDLSTSNDTPSKKFETKNMKS
ncbi:uncharacterized protein LOC113558259, partial [Rhopalosiphum maidis]|uniref:uncharacterized protein LOC113558259 n=1 Tax=Rhopalosiphum maidis TaxID=43146 RepID=UPI000F0051EF